ncbi:STAS domain-containing protein, partial [Pseudooceanicola sp. HF7]|uniref:STAS domain-containing protein n=1 Tax=Pseudooceanicola sp. HF7 TaxID=2721560 RepID=UPI00142F9286
MDLTTTTTDGVTIVTVNALRIDAAVAIQFKDLMREITRGLSGRIVLDLAQVDFIDSSGLGAIVAAMKQLESGAQLELATLRPNVDKVFRLTRMDAVFPIHSGAEA